MIAGQVDAVCVVHADVPVGRRGVVDSAIDKRPVDHPVLVHADGVTGDYSLDTKFHGGGDQAVYAYDSAEADRWAADLGREIPPGWFGENLRTSGIAVTDAVVGSRWRLGEVVLEVTIARKPCSTFARWVGEPNWVKRFTERGDVGAYLRVITPGALEGGVGISGGGCAVARSDRSRPVSRPKPRGSDGASRSRRSAGQGGTGRQARAPKTYPIVILTETQHIFAGCGHCLRR